MVFRIGDIQAVVAVLGICVACRTPQGIGICNHIPIGIIRSLTTRRIGDLRQFFRRVGERNGSARAVGDRGEFFIFVLEIQSITIAVFDPGDVVMITRWYLTKCMNQ